MSTIGSWVREQVGWLTGHRRMPFSSRATFRGELPAMLCWSLGTAVVEGSFAGFVATKALHAPDDLVAVIGAAPAFANLLAILWASASAGRDRRHMIALPLVVAAVLLGSVYLTPAAATGETPFWRRADVVFAAQCAGSLVCFAFANTIRSGLWRINYPPTHRGQVLARFTLWQMLVGSGFVVLLGYLMDRSPEWFRVVMPLAGVGALCSAGLYAILPSKRAALGTWRAGHGPSRHSARREAEGGAAEGDASESALGLAEGEPPGARAAGGFWAHMRASFAILRDDRPYAKYQFWQMVQGGGMMLIDVPLVLILKDRFQSDYSNAAWALVFVPKIAAALTTSLWARTFDRIDIWRFRARQTWWLLSARTFICLGVTLLNWPLLLLGLLIQGVGMAGGNLAWQLGHMQFGTRDKDSQYMGLHVTLTGLRGCILPFLGATLYQWIGWHVVWGSAILLATSTAGFNYNARRESARLASRHAAGRMK